ncbi:MAG: sensor histidine kinase, partial [Gemmatimonadales bacterium]
MRPRYWWTVILAGFAVYGAIAALDLASASVYFNSTHATIDWRSFTADRVLEQLTCGIFVAPLFWLVDRFPVSRALWRRHAPLLLLAVLAFVFLKYAIMQPLYALWAGRPEDPLMLAVIDNIVPVSFDFLAVIGVAHALRYYRDVGERERATAALQTQLVQARLDALRGQLQPHFIFNTLNAAATLMHEDVDGADQMLTQLGDLLRASLARSKPEITLAEELELVDRYLRLMRVRFSDRLSVSCTVDPEARRALVPAFLMQPLVENALEHGIARRAGPGHVAITARTTDGSLEIAVSDDGPGPSVDAPPGIGLTNTRARLQQL